jgi:hypothetical protein
MTLSRENVKRGERRNDARTASFEDERIDAHEGAASSTRNDIAQHR